MKCLGVSYGFHDSAAALVVDGQVVAADQEERFSRRKHDPTFPSAAIEFCFESAGLLPADLDKIVFYEKPLLKFDRILRSSLRGGGQGKRFFQAALRHWFVEGKFDPVGDLATALAVPRSRIGIVSHHDAHAASAFYCSPFDKALVITIDGVGEAEAMTVSEGRAGRLKRLHAQTVPHSLGLFYSAFTAYLGFEVNEGEYKVMGMAGFGKPERSEDILGLFDLSDPNGFRIDQSHFDFLAPKRLPYRESLVEWLGPAREAESPFDVEDTGPAGEKSRHYADLAASVQRCTEEVILDLVRKWIAKTGLKQVCLAGGVALNSLANARLKRELGIDLYVHPAAGDAGGAVGAALLGLSSESLAKGNASLTHAYLGKAFQQDELDRVLHGSLRRNANRFPDESQMIEAAAERLAAGKVIGWFQGRAEWGPRALGGRSILANPADPAMQARVNERIKFREVFRPFAPSVLAERAHEYYEILEGLGPSEPESFMLSVVRVRPEMRDKVPATTHVDGTARIQLVHQAVNPLYHALISALQARTGVPVVLNTSFNLRGEPIVGAPEDAVATFGFSKLDALVLGRTVIDK